MATKRQFAAWKATAKNFYRSHTDMGIVHIRSEIERATRDNSPDVTEYWEGVATAWEALMAEWAATAKV